jgi:hypothetical protein
MEITEFTFRIIIAGISGIITYFLLFKLIGKVGKNTIAIGRFNHQVKVLSLDF